MFVSAASAAYDPPPASPPQIVSAIRRPPMSRAEFAARPTGAKPQMAIAYAIPITHGTDAGWRSMFVGSRHAQIVTPSTKSTTNSFTKT